MPDRMFTFTGARFTVTEPDDGDRPVTLTALCVPWGVTVEANWWGDTIEFAAGAIAPTDPSRVKLLLDHSNHPMGYGTEFRSTPEGLWGTFEIPRGELVDPKTATAVRQMTNGIRDAVSIGADLDEIATHENRDGTVHMVCTAATLVETSSVVLPRFADARIAKIAAARRLHAGTPDAAEPTTDQDVDDDQEDTMPDTDLDLDARREAHTATLTATRPAGPAGRYRNFGEFTRAAATLTADPGYVRAVFAALADQVTGDVPGLTPEAWIADVVDILGSVTPTVQAFSRRPLPATGMTVNIPVVKQYPDIGIQAAEKADIASRKVLIEPEAFPVKTFAGGQDISIQTLERTDPSYLSILMGLFTKEMGIQLETAVAAALAAGTTATSPWDDAELNGSFIDAMAVVLDATLSLPTVAVMGVDCWKTLGKAKGTDGRPLFPGVSPVNPVGSFTLTETSGNVRGLNYWVSPLMSPKTCVIGIPDAFVTMQGAMGTLGADVPQKAGRDVAVYEFATYGVVDARGLVKMVDATALAATASKASK